MAAAVSALAAAMAAGSEGYTSTSVVADCRIIGLKDNFVVFVTCVIWSRVFYIGMHYKKCLV